ncbi:NAD(P)/FAD-dependent oxidoreductase [Martelella soudanensis]|uniref:NAD(P)/FAD-dependent oxidoreductase n=1 Tax=unclassified Martelella TaxID=2629616 RepID=UPI0015DEF8DC|nr:MULTISPECIES: FAD-binding oxidoreductase [unclassified Martelella]
MKDEAGADAVVIGGGIIGCMAARYLLAGGRRVTILERSAIAAGSSAGNAGILAFPEIVPIPSPGIAWKAPGWLLDPLGPLTIRPAYAARLAPWLWHFWRASSRANFERGLRVQAELMQLAADEFETIRKDARLSSFIVNTGTLDLYDSEKSFRAAAPDWAKKRAAGFDFHRVGRAEIEALQPGLAPLFEHAIYSDDGLQVSDPADFTRALADSLRQDGATITIAEVSAIEPIEAGARIRLADGGSIEARTVVVACGAWSKRLAKSLGEAVPLDTERGYNTTLPATAFPLKRQLYFNDHSFVATPLKDGIRIGGAVEFGGLDLPANFKRADMLLKLARRLMPGLETAGGKQWMGFRPSMPDCLPVIDRSKAAPNVLYAFGHGHLGLTQSAATGRLIAELAAQQKPSADLENLRFDRFSGR